MSSYVSLNQLEVADKVKSLYTNLSLEFGPAFQYDRFINWVAQYTRLSRDFHGLPHLISMSEFNPDLPKNSAIYSMVAGFFHDEDYPSIGEELNAISKPYIEKYVEIRDGKKFVKLLAADDKIGQILHTIFGFKEGQELSAFPIFTDGKLVNPGGINEFYSAVAAACELESLDKDDKYIAAIITAIEATIPFRGPNRMNELKARLEDANKKLDLDITSSDLDEIMIAAGHTANKDVISFLGGLDPEKDTEATTLAVVRTINGGDKLSPEEVPSLRDGFGRKNPGDYPPADFLTARLKRAGLYQLVIPGNTEKGEIQNLFYSVSLSDGSKYPANGWVDKANTLAYKVNLPVSIAEYARLASAAIVFSIAELSGDKGKNHKLLDFVDGMATRVTTNLPTGSSRTRELAYSCLCSRDQTAHDTRRSPLAELILCQLTEDQVIELGKKTRATLFPQRDPQAFLKLATEYLGDTVREIRDEIVKSLRQSGNQALAVKVQGIDLPKTGPSIS